MVNGPGRVSGTGAGELNCDALHKSLPGASGTMVLNEKSRAERGQASQWNLCTE